MKEAGTAGVQFQLGKVLHHIGLGSGGTDCPVHGSSDVEQNGIALFIDAHIQNRDEVPVFPELQQPCAEFRPLPDPRFRVLDAGGEHSEGFLGRSHIVDVEDDLTVVWSGVPPDPGTPEVVRQIDLCTSVHIVVQRFSVVDGVFP